MRQRLNLRGDLVCGTEGLDGPGEVRLYARFPHAVLNREQQEELKNWLDDGASSVWKKEALQLREQAKTGNAGLVAKLIDVQADLQVALGWQRMDNLRELTAEERCDLIENRMADSMHKLKKLLAELGSPMI